MTRDEALALMHEFTPSEALRRHMYAVEIAMRAMAERQGADIEAWGLAGLLHDFDYERFPNASHSPVAEHPGRRFSAWRWQGSRLADPGDEPPRPPAFPGLRPVALETSPVTVAGAAASRSFPTCRIPSSPVINRNQRQPT